MGKTSSLCYSLAAMVALASAIMGLVVQNPTQEFGMLFSLMKEGVAGKEDMKAFDKIYEGNTGNTQQKQKYDADVANSFYNLATKFYEYGWGDSFHFGWRLQGEGHAASIRNSQNFVAQKLRVNDMEPVLDLGCGIGGPLRGVVRATGANVTGLTINEHQVARAYEITGALPQYMRERCHYKVMDYLNIQGLPENHYAGAFYMESSLHCENRTKTFSETYRLLRPGGRLVAMEYVTLPAWDENNPEHKELMRLHLHGNGAARTPSIQEAVDMVKAAGFDVVEHYDFMAVGQKMYGEKEFPWWGDLQTGLYPSIYAIIPSLLPAHPWVRNNLPYLLNALVKVGLVPPDVPRVAELMNEGGDGLSGLGKLNAITPQYYILGVKPGA